MEKEWFSIIDTAVKIGLGALLTGVFSYLGVKSSKRLEKVKFLLEHKVKMLEKASEEIELYLHSWQRFTGAVSGVALRRKNENKESEALTPKNMAFLRGFFDDLGEAIQYRESAIAKLRLLGGSSVADDLEQCRNIEKELRNPIFFENKMFTHDEVDEYRKKLREHCSKIHSGLASFYQGLH